MRLGFIFGIVAPSTGGIDPSPGRRHKAADGHKQKDRQMSGMAPELHSPQPKEKRS
jgi:hypothetical protein